MRQRSPSPVRRNQTNTIHKTDKVDKDKDQPFSKDLHFKVLDSIQVMLDLIQYQIQGIIFPRFRSASRSLSRPRFGIKIN